MSASRWSLTLAAIAATAALALGSAPAAMAAPAPSATSATVMPGVLSAAKPKAKTKETPTIAWTTIKRQQKSHGARYSETLQIPYLKNASAKATSTFNKAISARVAAYRAIAKPVGKKSSKRAGGFRCVNAAWVRSGKVSSAVYKKRYASALISLSGLTCDRPAHSFDGSYGLTINLRTGKLMKRTAFVTAKPSAVTKVARRALARKHALDAAYASTPSSWMVSSSGVTYYYDPYAAGPYYQGAFRISLPWKTVRR